MKSYILKKDIVIKKGTLFVPAPYITKRNSEHFETNIGLTKNSCGVFTYCIDEKEELEEWFTEKVFDEKFYRERKFETLCRQFFFGLISQCEFKEKIKTYID